MIKIVTDTASGLTRQMAAQYGIDLIPQVVMFGTEALRDGVDITNEVFLQRLKMSKKFPTTSQPPVGDFVAAFRRHLDTGHEVVCIAVSSLLSGTYNAAETARQELGSNVASRITLVDSKNAATGQALMALEAARMVKAGRSVAEILARLDKMVAGMHMDFVLDTLDYLVKGGRAKRVQGLVGTLLNIKPLLTIRDGQVDILERPRTKSKAVARLRAIVDEAVRGKSRAQVGVTHTGSPAEAEALAQEFRRTYALDECLVIEMPPAVAAHAGPGALGAAYYVDT